MIYNDKDAIEYTPIPFSSFNQDVKIIFIKQFIEIVFYFRFETYIALKEIILQI
jgi:hypothetical protein